MKDGCRCAVAYVAARLRLRHDVGQLVDESTGRTCIHSGEVSESAIHVYDYQRSCQLVGEAGALYDTALRNAIQLSLVGDRFYGYDYDSHRRFLGRIEAGRVSLFDAVEARWFEYRFENVLG